MSLPVGRQLCQRESLAEDMEVVGQLLAVTGTVPPRVTSCSQESAAARIACSPGALVTSGSWRTTSPWSTIQRAPPGGELPPMESRRPSRVHL